MIIKLENLRKLPTAQRIFKNGDYKSEVMDDRIRRSKAYLIEVPKREKRDNYRKARFKEKVAENSLETKKNMIREII